MQTVVTMKLITLLALSSMATKASEIDPAYAQHLADAIKKAENSRHHPYGIEIHCKDPRRVCLNTIRHAWRDWQAEGCPGSFIAYLGNRYCPESVDAVGNRNWKRNVPSLM